MKGLKPGMIVKVLFSATVIFSLMSFSLLGGLAFGHAPSAHKVRVVKFNKPQPAPAFTLPNTAGEPTALKHFKGRYVLLNFWATWCPPCVREMPSMERLAARMADRPFTVLAISLDREGAKKVIPFVERLKITFPILLDPKSIVSGQYGARDLPATFLIDPLGRVIAAAKGEQDWGGDDMVGFLKELMVTES